MSPILFLIVVFAIMVADWLNEKFNYSLSFNCGAKRFAGICILLTAACVVVFTFSNEPNAYWSTRAGVAAGILLIGGIIMASDSSR
jgi:phosphatidylserine synthase